MSGLEIYPLAAAGQHPNVNVTLMFIHFLIQKKLVEVDTNVMRSFCGSGIGDTINNGAIFEKGKLPDGVELGQTCSTDDNLKKELQEALAKLQEMEKHKNDSDIKNQNQEKEIKQLKVKLEEYEKKYQKSSVCDFTSHLQKQKVKEDNGEYTVELRGGFPHHAKVVIIGTAGVNNARMFFSLKKERGTAFQLDNRWQYYDSVNETIMNTKKEDWGWEIKSKPAAIEPGEDFTVSIECQREEFQICINGWPFATYKHRVSPDDIRELVVSGAEKILNVYYMWYPEPVPVSSEYYDSFN